MWTCCRGYLLCESYFTWLPSMVRLAMTQVGLWLLHSSLANLASLPLLCIWVIKSLLFMTTGAYYSLQLRAGRPRLGRRMWHRAGTVTHQPHHLRSDPTCVHEAKCFSIYSFKNYIACLEALSTNKLDRRYLKQFCGVLVRAGKNYSKLEQSMLPILDFGTGKNVVVINTGHAIQVPSYSIQT